MYSPSQIAFALFPNNIKGTSWKKGADDKYTNKSKRASHHAAINEVKKTLSYYGYSAGTLTINPDHSNAQQIEITKNLPLPKGLKTKAFVDNRPDSPKSKLPSTKAETAGYTAFQTGKSIFLVCNRCLKSQGAPDFHCHAVAYLLVDATQSEKDQCTVLKVTEVFPHNSQCTTVIKDRINSIFDTREGGKGYGLLPFPQAEIERGVFNHIKKVLGGMSHGDVHHGM